MVVNFKDVFDNLSPSADAAAYTAEEGDYSSSKVSTTTTTTTTNILVTTNTPSLSAPLLIS